MKSYAKAGGKLSQPHSSPFAVFAVKPRSGRINRKDKNSFQSIYTILIRFPPSKSHNSFPPASHSAAASSAPHPKAALGRVQSCGSGGGQGNNNHNGARNRASSRWVADYEDKIGAPIYLFMI